MKYLLVCMITLLLSLNVYSQVPKLVLPESVQNAFNILYPGVENVEWEKEGSDYEAEFVYNDSLRSVLIDIKGIVLETETEPYDKKEIDDDGDENENENKEEDDDNEEDDD